MNMRFKLLNIQQLIHTAFRFENFERVVTLLVFLDLLDRIHKFIDYGYKAADVVYAAFLH